MLTIEDVASEIGLTSNKVLSRAKAAGYQLSHESLLSDDMYTILCALRDYTPAQIREIRRRSPSAFSTEDAWRSKAIIKGYSATERRELLDLQQARDEANMLRKSIRELSVLGLSMAFDDQVRESVADALAKVNALEISLLEEIERMEQISTSLRDEFAPHIANLEQQTEEIDRLKSTWTTAARSNCADFSSILQPSLDEIRKKLSALGLLFTDDVLTGCLDAIGRGKPLLLVGPPGTGKTELARALPSVFSLGDSQKIDATFIPADPAWSSEHIVGHKWIMAGQIVPRPGFFLEAVLRCINQRGGHWLVIDDLGQVDVDYAFGPLRSVLSDMGDVRFRSAAVVNLPGFRDSVPIPESFRLIVTMNDSDLGSSLSPSFYDRFAQVRVSPPDRNIQQKLLEHLAEMEELSYLGPFEEMLLSTLDALRSSGTRPGGSAIEIGVRGAQDLARELNLHGGRGEHEDAVFDKAVSNWLRPRLSTVDAPALKQLLLRFEEIASLSVAATLVADRLRTVEHGHLL